MSLVKLFAQWFSTASIVQNPHSLEIKYYTIVLLIYKILLNITLHKYTLVPDKTYKSREKGIQGIDWLYPKKEKIRLSIALQEIKILYNWWVDLRTQRTDAWKDIDTTYGQFKEEWLQTTETENNEYKEFMDKCRHAEKLQKLYNTEDTKMLLRLIQIRNYL